MEFSRALYQELLVWKRTSNGKTAFLIDGARRVGKTHIAKLFGKNEYRTCLYIDFTRPFKGVVDIIRDDAHDFDLFFSKLSVLSGVPLYRRESLIVFDEVQQCPEARQLIKHLVEDGRYDYLETGSLLSMRTNIRDIVIPSEEEHHAMLPMSFQEFLLARGEPMVWDVIRSAYEDRQPMGRTLHEKAMGLFREYMLVGGMPQSVAAYLGDGASRDFAAADKAKRGILRLHRDDVVKFAGGYSAKVEAVFDQIPGQLTKKDKAYRLAAISKSARMREYEDAFLWLDDARIVNPCYNATDPSAGLALSEDHATRKLYMADTGLLVTASFMDGNFSDATLYRDILLDRLGINEGMLMENIVAQALKRSSNRLYFYSRSNSDDRKNDIEIDFLIKRSGRISPVEVKSASYTKHASLDKFRARFHERLGESYILYTKDLMIKDNIVHLPLYMAELL